MTKTSNLKQQLEQIIQKDYQLRNNSQHRVLINFIQNSIPSCNEQFAKKLSFYIQIRSSSIQEQVFQSETIFLILVNELTCQFQYRQIYNASKIQDVSKQSFCIVIHAKAIINCQNIGKIEDEIKFLQSCPYFADISKKKLFQLLRNTKISKWMFGQSIYQQNDLIQTNQQGVFIIRQGQFCFSKKDSSGLKSFQIISCSKGHLFANQVVSQQQIIIKRKYTVTCKSSIGLIYIIKDDFFNLILRKQCEEVLIQNNQKTHQLAEVKFIKIQKNRLQNSQFLYPTTRRSYSSLLNFSNEKKPAPVTLRSVSRFQNSDQQRKKIINFPSLQNKTHKQIQKQLKKVFNPQYREQIQLIKKKENCLKLKQLAKSYSSKLTRGEILFGLIKNSWQFERDRRKPILKN